MLRKLFAVSAVMAMVVAVSSDAEAGKCRVKRNRRCCQQRTHVCPAPCGVCNTPAVEAAPAADAPAAEAAPAPPAEAK